MKTERARPWRVRSVARWGMLIAGMLPALVGCYPYDDNQSASTYDIALTQFSSKANFYPTQPPPNTTYYLPPVKHIVPPGGTDTIPPTYDSLIESQIAANMAARQYTRITTDITPPNPQPDFIVTASITTTTYTGYYYGAWWGYGCYCYGGYYPYMQPYTFSTGTILIDMANQAQVDSDPSVQTAGIIWGCGINGLLGAGSTTSRITNQINQCFSQSPYLGP